MGFVIGLLTVVMVFDCLLLILLVLIQLPMKEAGAALAFGGGTTDALFGAGSGTVLTKITKYAAAAFFVLAIIVSMLVSKFRTAGSSSFSQGLANPTSAGPAPTPPGVPTTSPSVQSVTPSAQTSSIALPLPEATNAAPAALNPATSNAPASTPK